MNTPGPTERALEKARGIVEVEQHLHNRQRVSVCPSCQGLVNEIASALDAERAAVWEEAAGIAEAGQGCRYVDHAQRFCQCFEIAAQIRDRARAKGERT